jgi:hypothetical protein
MFPNLKKITNHIHNYNVSLYNNAKNEQDYLLIFLAAIILMFIISDYTEGLKYKLVTICIYSSLYFLLAGMDELWKKFNINYPQFKTSLIAKHFKKVLFLCWLIFCIVNQRYTMLMVYLIIIVIYIIYSHITSKNQNKSINSNIDSERKLKKKLNFIQKYFHDADILSYHWNKEFIQFRYLRDTVYISALGVFFYLYYIGLTDPKTNVIIVQIIIINAFLINVMLYIDYVIAAVGNPKVLLNLDWAKVYKVLKGLGVSAGISIVYVAGATNPIISEPWMPGAHLIQDSLLGYRYKTEEAGSVARAFRYAVILDPQPVPVDEDGWVDTNKCYEIAAAKGDKFAIQFYNKVILESAPWPFKPNPLPENTRIFQKELAQNEINEIIDNTHKDVLNSGSLDNKK